MSVADNAVHSSFLTLIARGAMIIALPISVWIAGYVQGVGSDLATLKGRVGVIENSLQIGRVSRDNQFEDVDRQFNELKAALGRLDDRTIEILKQINEP